MKTGKLERWLLLEQSGELSARQSRLLKRELDASEESRRLRSELNLMSRSINKPEIELSPWIITRIVARLRGESRSAFNFYKLLKPALALAACLTVTVSLLNFHGEQTSSAPAAIVAAAGVDVWDDPFDKDLCKLENLIASISSDPIDSMEM